MKSADEFRVVYTTSNNYDNASQIAKILVTERLAACCSIIQNVVSFFAWKEAIHERHEYLLIIKTHSAKLEVLEQRIIEMHVDDVPEIIALPMDSASEQYLDWMSNTIR